jgi:hypothetical protein
MLTIRRSRASRPSFLFRVKSVPGERAHSSGLDATARTELEALMGVFRSTRRRNDVIELYYEGKVGPRPIGSDTLMSQV